MKLKPIQIGFYFLTLLESIFLTQAELILLPLEVNKPYYPDHQFFQALQNHFNYLDPPITLTHTGLDTPYYQPSDDVSSLGWILIGDETNLHALWSGDINACKHVPTNNLSPSDISNIGQVSEAKNSKTTEFANICTFQKAKKYCELHGGELILPDDNLKGILSKIARQENVGAELASITSKLYQQLSSSNKYWANLQVEFNQVEVDWLVNMTTSSQVALNQVEIPQVLLQNVNLTETVDVKYHQNFLQPGAAVTQKFALTSLSKSLQGGALFQDNCFSYNLDQPDILLSHNCYDQNIRPLCGIKDLFEYSAVCPQDLGVDYCGDHVSPFLVKRLRDRGASFSSRKSSDLHQFGEKYGKLDHPDNFNQFLKSVFNQLDLGNLYDPEIYIDCHSVDRRKNIHSLSAKICSNAKNHQSLENRTGTCSCPVDLEEKLRTLPLFLDEKAEMSFESQEVLKTLSQSDAGADSFTYCCQPAYKFVSSSPKFKYEPVSESNNRCFKINYADVILTSATIYFWNMHNFEEANTKKWWIDVNRTPLTSKIEGLCQQLVCSSPPLMHNQANISNLSSTWKTKFVQDDLVTYNCPANFCGSYSITCEYHDISNTLQWSQPEGYCQEKYCVLDQSWKELKFGKFIFNDNLVTESSRFVFHLSDNSEMQVECDPGYTYYDIPIKCEIEKYERILKDFDVTRNSDICENEIRLKARDDCQPTMCVDAPCQGLDLHESNMLTYTDGQYSTDWAIGLSVSFAEHQSFKFSVLQSASLAEGQSCIAPVWQIANLAKRQFCRAPVC